MPVSECYTLKCSHANSYSFVSVFLPLGLCLWDLSLSCVFLVYLHTPAGIWSREDATIGTSFYCWWPCECCQASAARLWTFFFFLRVGNFLRERKRAPERQEGTRVGCPMNILINAFCYTYIRISADLGGASLYHKVCVWSISVNAAQEFSNNLLSLPSKVYESSSWQHLILWILCNLVSLGDKQTYFIVDLIFISLFTNEVESLFICLLVAGTFFCEVLVDNFVYFSLLKCLFLNDLKKLFIYFG